MVAISRLKYAQLVLCVTGTTYRSLRLPQREVFPQRGTVPHREGKSRRSRDSVAILSQHQALGVKGRSGPDRISKLLAGTLSTEPTSRSVLTAYTQEVLYTLAAEEEIPILTREESDHASIPLEIESRRPEEDRRLFAPHHRSLPPFHHLSPFPLLAIPSQS